MKTLLLFQFPILHPESGNLLFNRIYLLAFFVVILICLIAGYRKKIPLGHLLLAAVTLVLFFILGTKALAFSANDWHQLFLHGQWPVPMRKTMLGGMAGLAVGILLFMSWIRNHRGLLDMVAIIIPSGMAIQRIGCLFAGCCFGIPTDLPWGIRYSAHSHAWASQQASGLIHPGDLLSLPVHPTQVYDLLCCLLIIVLVIKMGKHLKAEGSRLLLTIALYCFFRFFIEFARDPMSDFFPGTFLGIKYIQWWILAGLIVLVAIILIRELKAGAGKTLTINREENFFRSFSLSLFLVAVYLVTKRFYDMPEKLVLLSLLLPLIVMTALKLFRKITVPGLRLATGCLAAGVVVLTSQTYIPKDRGEKVSYYEISAGNTIGTFYNEYRVIQPTLVTGYDCDGTPYTYTDYLPGTSHDFKHQTSIGGLDFSFKQNVNHYRRLAVGAGFYMGQETATAADMNFSERNFIYVLNPSFRYDWRWFGLKGGLYLGNFNFITKEIEIGYNVNNVGNHTGDMTVFHVFPQVAFRVGPYDILYMEVHLTDHFPQGNPVWPISVGVGTGLGKLDGTRVGFGYSTSGYYGECYIPVKDKYVIQGGLAGLENQTWSVSIGFGYRFGYKTTTKKIKHPISVSKDQNR